MSFTQPYYPFRLAVLLSGQGTTLQNLLNAISQRKLQANVRVVLSSRPDAFGLLRAAQWNIPAELVSYADYAPDLQLYSQKITSRLLPYKPDLIVMGGFLSRYLVPECFSNKVINIHPSLIPQFCGKGFYGRRVHEAVKAANAQKTGCTVHFVDNEYDHGTIIAQKEVTLSPQDTVDTIQTKVTQLEKQLYPAIIQQFVHKHSPPKKHIS